MEPRQNCLTGLLGLSLREHSNAVLLSWLVSQVFFFVCSSSLSLDNFVCSSCCSFSPDLRRCAPPRRSGVARQRFAGWILLYEVACERVGRMYRGFAFGCGGRSDVRDDAAGGFLKIRATMNRMRAQVTEARARSSPCQRCRRSRQRQRAAALRLRSDRLRRAASSATTTTTRLCCLLTNYFHTCSVSAQSFVLYSTCTAFVLLRVDP